MPWKEVTAVNERIEFVVRLKAGERMTDLCREFGISRKTGYKFEERYDEHGPKGLYDVSRRPKRLARQMSAGIQRAILELKRENQRGEPLRFKRCCGANSHRWNCQYGAVFTICWIETAWLRNDPNGDAIMRM